MALTRAQLDADTRALESLAVEHGLVMTSGLLQQLVAYRDLMVTWNDRVRLVSRSDTERILGRHVFESLLIRDHVPASATRLADIGSGGGLPGVPLCLAEERLQVSLIESARMKTLFLKEVARTIEPLRLEVLHQRAEEVARSRSGTFDVITSRAVASLDQVWGYAEPLLKPHGCLVSLKGPGEAAADLASTGIVFTEHVIRVEDRSVAVVVINKD